MNIPRTFSASRPSTPAALDAGQTEGRGGRRTEIPDPTEILGKAAAAAQIGRAADSRAGAAPTPAPTFGGTTTASTTAPHGTPRHGPAAVPKVFDIV
jgi:hypothetical protein